MNSVNLVVTLATDPGENVVLGTRIIWAEAFLRPAPDDEPPPFPDRVRVTAAANSVAGIRMQETRRGDLLAVTGSLRRTRQELGKAGELEVLATIVSRLAVPA